jgi:hypothetical protein
MEDVMDAVTDLTRQCKKLEERNLQLETELASKWSSAEETGHAMIEDREIHGHMLKEAKRKLNLVKRKIADRERFITAQRDAASGKVVLDVGGTKFTTTLATLGDSVLAALFYAQQDVETGEDGAVFIDRDPHAFGNILQVPPSHSR